VLEAAWILVPEAGIDPAHPFFRTPVLCGSQDSQFHCETSTPSFDWFLDQVLRLGDDTNKDQIVILNSKYLFILNSFDNLNAKINFRL
jgi:hypothetical protein